MLSSVPYFKITEFLKHKLTKTKSRKQNVHCFNLLSCKKKTLIKKVFQLQNKCSLRKNTSQLLEFLPKLGILGRTIFVNPLADFFAVLNKTVRIFKRFMGPVFAVCSYVTAPRMLLLCKLFKLKTYMKSLFDLNNPCIFSCYDLFIGMRSSVL